LPNIEIKSHSHLHAKVYWGSNQAIVGSANFSANDLGFEKTEKNGWIEAGMIINDEESILHKIEVWFDKLWFDSESMIVNLKSLTIQFYQKHAKIGKREENIFLKLF
jgi:phosphatidylserine/phosphatidylglycerophosphate/cardiolipin synthase-like enzyme